LAELSLGRIKSYRRENRESVTLVSAGDREAASLAQAAEGGPEEPVNGDKSKAEHGNGEAAREVEAIGDRAHQLGQNGTAHDRHHDER